MVRYALFGFDQLLLAGSIGHGITLVGRCLTLSRAGTMGGHFGEMFDECSMGGRNVFVGFPQTLVTTGAQGGNRTRDLRITSALLYRLSYLGAEAILGAG